MERSSIRRCLTRLTKQVRLHAGENGSLTTCITQNEYENESEAVKTAVKEEYEKQKKGTRRRR
jgi:hypothetical protein